MYGLSSRPVVYDYNLGPPSVSHIPRSDSRSLDFSLGLAILITFRIYPLSRPSTSVSDRCHLLYLVFTVNLTPVVDTHITICLCERLNNSWLA